MQKIIKIVLLVLFVSALPFAESASARKNGGVALRVCTYNVRGDLARDTATVNAWRLRRDSLCKIVEHHQFDIVCMQEVMSHQLEYIVDATGYTFAGSRGLFNPILYKAERFELLHTETFWLSDSMEPFSKGWDAKYDRYCTWVHLRDRKTKAEVFVFNVHLDHRGEVARTKGAELVCRQARRFAGDAPLIVCGDMNSTDTTSAYATYVSHLSDARKVAAKVEGAEGTAHSFGQVAPVRIDYIFVSQGIGVKAYDVDDESYPNGMYPSDHYAVFADMVIEK